jgi:hypothetical protein
LRFREDRQGKIMSRPSVLLGFDSWSTALLVPSLALEAAPGTGCHMRGRRSAGLEGRNSDSPILKSFPDPLRPLVRSGELQVENK